MSIARRRVLDDASGHTSTAAGPPVAARRDRSLFAVLLGRTLSWLAAWIAPVGRSSLYVGLLLVALSALRLPRDVGGVADVFLLLSMVCAILLLLQGRTLKVGLLRTHAIGLSLVVSGVVIGTLLESSEDWRSLLQLSKFLFATTATIVACMVLLERRRQLRTALGCWVVSAALTSVNALLQASLGISLSGDEPLGDRMTGLSGNPNHLGAVAGMAIGGALCLAALSQRLVRMLWLTAAVICIFGVVASASRAGAVIGLASVGLWAVMSHRSNRQLTILVLGCCMAGAAVASFIFVQVWGGRDVSDRLVRAADDPYGDVAVATRLVQYEDILRDALRNPLVGVGLAETDVDFRGLLVHNTFLILFRAGGVLAIAGIIVIFTDLLLKGVVAYGETSSRSTRYLVIGLLAGTVGLILDGLVEPVLFQRHYWIPSALLLASISIERGHKTQTRIHPRHRSPAGRHSRNHRKYQHQPQQSRKNA